MREYLERARDIIKEKGPRCEEMELLRKEVTNSSDPFIRNVLDI